MGERTTWRKAIIGVGIDRGRYRWFPQAWWMRLPQDARGVKTAWGRRAVMVVWGPLPTVRAASGEGTDG